MNTWDAPNERLQCEAAVCALLVLERGIVCLKNGWPMFATLDDLERAGGWGQPSQIWLDLPGVPAVRVVKRSHGAYGPALGQMEDRLKFPYWESPVCSNRYQSIPPPTPTNGAHLAGIHTNWLMARPRSRR